jgi:hypothetical protein
MQRRDDIYEFSQFQITIATKCRTINTLHESKLCSKSGTSEQPLVSVYRVYFVSSDNILM